MDIQTLEHLLEQSWTAQTSSDPTRWTTDNKAWGQCAVTSALVQDYLGGSIIWAPATLPNGEEISHYFNSVDGKEIDLTRQQFPEGTTIPTGIPKTKDYTSTREYILSFQATQERYRLLKQQIEEKL